VEFFIPLDMSQFCHIHHLRRSDGVRKMARKPTQNGRKNCHRERVSLAKNGTGWELRKSVYVETDTGIRKRRLPYVAHLSKSASWELKRQHRGAALERAIAQWIEEHDKP
jgi:hypothetical protein